MTQSKIATIIRQAGEIILAASQPEVYQKEGHANFVTQTDIDVQAFLLERVGAAIPQAQFLAEEKDNAVLSDALTFVVDPIDGTLNFMHDRRASAISVALVEKREPVMGFVYQPWLREMYFAAKGEGAFLNGRRLHVSPVPFERAVVDFGTAPYREELWPRGLTLCEAFLRQTADLRRCGSAALDLCEVAAGRAEVFWELQLSPWDYAAGALMVTEAGGRISDCDGQPLCHGSKTGVLAASAECYEKALEVLLAHR